jgi:hypothetical protein
MTYVTALPAVPLADAVTSLLPDAPSGDVIVIDELPDDPAAIVSEAGENVLNHPAELPAKLAVRLNVRGPQELGSGLFTVTVYASALPAIPVCVAGTVDTVGAVLQLWTT